MTHCNRILKSLFLFFPLLLSATLSANSYASQSLEQQRKLYQQAGKQLKADQLEQYFQTKARLTDYPLYPYLEQRELEHNFDKVSQHQIDLYAKQYQDIPTNYLLQQRWLGYLAGKQRWQQYLTAYNNAAISKERYQCHYRTALLKTGKKAEALKNIETLWNKGHSISDACNPVFDHWISKHKGPDSDLAYQRFWKAVDKNSISLAKYLRRFITKKDQKQATAKFLQIRNNPALIKNTDILHGDNIASRSSYLYGIERLSRKSPQTATKIWLKVRPQLSIGNNQQLKLNQTLARRLASKNDKHTDALIDQVNSPLDEEIQSRRFKLALVQQNWKKIYNLIDKLPDDIQQNENWVYWKTIAASHLSGLKPEYSDAFLKLSKARSYYGLLAAQVLKTRFRLNPAQDKPDDALLSEFADQAAVKRMQELYWQNELYLGRREWNQLTQAMDTDQLRIAATTVHSWGWHSLAIRGIAKARHWDDISLRFPMPYEKLFEQRAGKFAIDTNWARAVARQESAYQPYARSHVGARGLMQLMPKTARDTARKNKINYKNTADLYIPATNISLGVAYLAEMQKRFKENQVYATAAYNAGPHRVKNWLKARGDLPIDIWIETIPFNETRKYVMSVMAYHAIYRTLAGQPAHLLNNKTAFRLAMKNSTGAQQAKQLRDFIQLNSKATLTQ
ncbi:transglycosylase SLT domain-containing protein [Amphritea balenae]|nr:transglycosylase SLT domain-containing protein [Amphritea balenae]